MSKATPQQVAALLKDLTSKCGLTTQEALPTIKSLVEARIFSLSAISEGSLPASIPQAVQNKLVKGNKKKKRASTTAATSNKRRKKTPITIPPVTEEPSQILINRSPVLTLWASIVAQTQYKNLSWEEALSLGGAYAATTAKGKGTSLGIFTKTEDKAPKEVDGDDESSDIKMYQIMGQDLSAKTTPVGIRAMVGDREQDPHTTWNLLKKRFGESLGIVIQKMQAAADKLEDPALAYSFYMHIRPDIPHGTKGWGAHGQFVMSKMDDFFQETP